MKSQGIFEQDVVTSGHSADVEIQRAGTLPNATQLVVTELGWEAGPLGLLAKALAGCLCCSHSASANMGMTLSERRGLYLLTMQSGLGFTLLLNSIARTEMYIRSDRNRKDVLSIPCTGSSLSGSSPFLCFTACRSHG